MTTTLIVALVFAVAAAGAFALAWAFSRGQPSGATGAGAFFAFGWMSATIAGVAILALRHGDMRAARILTTGPEPTTPGGRGSLGGAVRSRGDAYFEMRSRAPAIFMGASAVLLLVAEVLLLGERRTTVLGAGIGAVVALLLGNGARSVWPRPDKPLPPGG